MTKAQNKEAVKLFNCLLDFWQGNGADPCVAITVMMAMSHRIVTDQFKMDEDEAILVLHEHLEQCQRNLKQKVVVE